MCTGPAAKRCPTEELAWELYEDYGYRPRALRPCLTRRPAGALTGRDAARPGRIRRLLRVHRPGRR